MADEPDDDFDLDDDFAFDDMTVEDRARTMGWKPLEEFGGDPRRWTDAEAFVAKGEQMMPVMRDQNHRMSERIAKYENEVSSLRNTVSEQTAAIKDAMDLARRADSAGYKRAMDELEAQRREAVSLGDTEAYDQITDQIKAAEREREAGNVTVPIPPPVPVQQQQSPETVQFIADNPWFNEDAILNDAMIKAHQAIMVRHPNMPLAQQYAAAKKSVVTHFPQFFQQDEEEEEMAEAPRPRPRLRAQPLAPTAGTNGSRPGRSPFDKIADPTEREEAKKAFAGVAKYDPDATAEEYVTLYLNPKTDVLALRARRGKALN